MIPPYVLDAQCGDADAWVELVRKHGAYVRNIAARVLRDPFWAEDAAQGVFAHLVDALKTFRGESSFKTWLYLVTVRWVYCKYDRRKGRIEQVAFEDLSKDDYDFTIEFGVRDRSLDFVAGRIDLQRALGRIHPKYRRVIILHYVYGASYGEVARIERKTVTAAKSSVWWATRALKREMTGKCWVKGKGGRRVKETV